MDVLSAASEVTVFGAIELTGCIVKICGHYITEVKNARDDILSLRGSSGYLLNRRFCACNCSP